MCKLIEKMPKQKEKIYYFRENKKSKEGNNINKETKEGEV